MKVIRRGETPKQDATGAPMFFGGKVSRENLVGGDVSRYYNFNIINFEAGARNKLHTHSRDQILFVVSGRGIVATEDGEREVAEGDTILIPEGERHWHGAAHDSDFAHISLTTPDTQNQIID